MNLLSLNKNIFFFFILFLFSSALFSEESVDIWSKKNLKDKAVIDVTNNNSLKKEKSKININTKLPKQITIDSANLKLNKNLIYGIFEPEKNNLTLNMWLNSEGTRVKDTIERINKIKLSSFAEEIFVNTLFTISSPPSQNMSNEDFIEYKLDWMINNQRQDLISAFLNKNKEFPNKEKIIKYLVDQNISKSNIEQACEKIALLDNNIRNSYLDQFKIICLIKHKKKNEAMLMHDLLKEQKLSNNFFDSKINYLLGLSKKEDKKIDDTSLLNFYLSSITVSEFDYSPNKKTKKQIWQYLNAAKLLKVNNFESNEQIKYLEIAANKDNLNYSYIFEIYKNIKFDLNDFLNIDKIYQMLDPVSARALTYQKILLSDNIKTKLKYIFLLNDLFIEDKLFNISRNYLDQELKLFNTQEVPVEYTDLVSKNIIDTTKNKLNKIKLSDKKYHTSKIIRFYTLKNISLSKVEKDIKSVSKKIKKNKKYQISLKDAALFESLESDGIILPKEIDYNQIKKNNLPPTELLNFIKNNEIGMLLLRIVELIGEDEILDLDDQTIYFINHLFTKSGLIKFRNRILFVALPERNKI